MVMSAEKEAALKQEQQFKGRGEAKEAKEDPRCSIWRTSKYGQGQGRSKGPTGVGCHPQLFG